MPPVIDVIEVMLRLQIPPNFGDFVDFDADFCHFAPIFFVWCKKLF